MHAAFVTKSIVIAALFVSGSDYSSHRFDCRCGSLAVPSGFTIDRKNYKEGEITTLKYPDGSRIILHCGGMMNLPLLSGTHYLPSTTRHTALRDEIVGHTGNLYWREDDYVRQKPHGKFISFVEMFPPDIAYDKVPFERKKNFDLARDSFKASAVSNK